MRWERSKPLWPIVAALGLLLLLSLAAPRSWQELGSRNPRPVLPPRVEPSFERAISEPTLAPLPIAQPTEKLPPRQKFDFDTLLSVRDKVLAILDQMPPAEQPAPSSSQPPQVLVTSERDRLAMIPRRAPVRDQLSGPTLPGETAKTEVADFAAILLEAAESSEPASTAPTTITAPTICPRLALQPTLVDPTENQPTEIRRTETQLVETQPIVETLPVEFDPPQPTKPKLPAPPPVEPPPLRHRPLSLIKALEAFKANSPEAVWSQQVLAQVQLLTEESTTERPEVATTLAQLEQLHVTGLKESTVAIDPTTINPWRQTAEALGRRLVLWRLLLDPEQPTIIEGAPASTKMLPVLSEIASLLEVEQNGSDWREYLLLDRIAAAMSEGISSPALARAKLAQEVLSRMADARLTDTQRDFLATGPLHRLQLSLRSWAAGKVNLETLAALVERYESGREARYAAVIAQLQQRLKWSDDPQLQELAAHLDLHYRGANMRIAMSDKLFNRMMPKQKPIVSPVNDRIAGAKVFGRARTTTQLQVRLLPDPEAWHVSLEAFGKVYSDTRSDTWPARIRNAAKMQYQARTEISLDEQGVHLSPAQATAQGRNDLLGVDSQLDPIPIVGYLLRDMARKKHKKSRPLALSQAKAKVVRQAKERMNSTLKQKVEELEQRFRDKVLAPIEELALLAEPLDMHTTSDRAVMQLRLANRGQLAAHTLRPLAPSDSVLSLQMHESAFNNAMAGLGLDGRRLTMLELHEFLSQRFGRPNAAPPEDLPRRAVIEFARHDAIRVRCDEDRLELVMSVVELAHRRDKIKNFQIHVHFRPVLDGLDVKLVRDGTLQFSGRRLKTGPRVVLHSVIGKVLVKDQEINLVNAKMKTDPRLAGLMVTQLVIEDGWIGLALGPAHPRRTAWRSPIPDVLSTPFLR